MRLVIEWSYLVTLKLVSFYQKIASFESLKIYYHPFRIFNWLHLLFFLTGMIKMQAEYCGILEVLLVLHTRYFNVGWLYVISVRTALLAIIGFMPTHGNGAIGSLDYKPEERKLLARK